METYKPKEHKAEVEKLADICAMQHINTNNDFSTSIKMIKTVSEVYEQNTNSAKG